MKICRPPLMTATGWAAILLTFACDRDAHRTPPPDTAQKGAPLASPGAVERRDIALVRVVQALPNGAATDVFAGDNVAFPRLEFRTVTAYRELPNEKTTFRLRPAGKDRSEPLAEAKEGLDAGKRYTVVVMPGDKREGANLKVFSDEAAAPAEGKAKVRVVNASPQTGSVDVLVGGRVDPVVGGVDFKDASAYHEVAPVSGTLEVRHDKTVLAHLPNAHLQGGKIYTILVLGRQGNKQVGSMPS